MTSLRGMADPRCAGTDTVAYHLAHRALPKTTLCSFGSAGAENSSIIPTGSIGYPSSNMGLGQGSPFAEADTIAETVQIAETLAYADAVPSGIMAWLHQLRDSDLDQIPDADTHLAPYPENSGQRVPRRN